MNKWMVASGVVGILSLVAVVWAEPAPPPEGRGERTVQRMRGEGGGGLAGEGQRPGREMLLRALLQNPELAARAGLSEGKQQALREAAFAYREQMVKLRGEAEMGRLQVEKLTAVPAPDEAAVMKAIEAAGQQEIAVRKAEIAFQLKMKSLVGEDVLRKLREQARDSMDERRGDRGPGDEMQEGGRRPGPPAEGQRAPWMRERMDPPAGERPPPGA